MKYNALWAGLVLAGLSGVGCNKTQVTSSTGMGVQAPEGGGGQMAAANQNQPAASPEEALFNTSCGKCHSVRGAGGPGGGAGPVSRIMAGGQRGPDLGKIGSKMSKDQIVAFVRDPKAHKPNARMPAIDASKVSDADLGTIATYLTGLK